MKMKSFLYFSSTDWNRQLIQMYRRQTTSTIFFHPCHLNVPQCQMYIYELTLRYGRRFFFSSPFIREWKNIFRHLKFFRLNACLATVCVCLFVCLLVFNPKIPSICRSGILKIHYSRKDNWNWISSQQRNVSIEHSARRALLSWWPPLVYTVCTIERISQISYTYLHTSCHICVYLFVHRVIIVLGGYFVKKKKSNKITKVENKPLTHSHKQTHTLYYLMCTELQIRETEMCGNAFRNEMFAH